jgi:hypothetical protein
VSSNLTIGSMIFEVSVHANQNFPVCAEDIGKTALADTAAVCLSPHEQSLSLLAPEEFSVFANALVCTYEVKDVYMKDDLLPTARHVLPGIAAAVVYDYAVQHQVPVLGIAPAHTRRNKWTVKAPGDPPRVYGGPAKPPHEAATKFSPPVGK